MDTLKFDLVAPEAALFSGNVNQIDIPGTEGDFGVLPGHAPVISTIRPGVIKVYTGKEAKKYVVASGIAEVNALSCTVLAERIIDLDSITRSEAEKMLAKARDLLEKSLEEDEKIIAAREIDLAEALISSLS